MNYNNSERKYFCMNCKEEIINEKGKGNMYTKRFCSELCREKYLE
ncbi:MAG: hypothetical protein ABIA76_04580 [Candidatus Diapherotrites archaeon]